MKIYITKYALTIGILEFEGKITSTSDDMVQVNKYEYYHKPFWYLTKEDAVEHANKLKANKIIALKKQISKLEKITF